MSRACWHKQSPLHSLQPGEECVEPEWTPWMDTQQQVNCRGGCVVLWTLVHVESMNHICHILFSSEHILNMRSQGKRRIKHLFILIFLFQESWKNFRLWSNLSEKKKKDLVKLNVDRFFEDPRTLSRTPTEGTSTLNNTFRVFSCEELVLDTFHTAQFHMPFMSLRPNWSAHMNHFIGSCCRVVFKAHRHPAAAAYHPPEGKENGMMALL